jgi:hypothetical protein
MSGFLFGVNLFFRHPLSHFLRHNSSGERID